MPGRPTILKKIVGRTVLAVGAVGGVSTIISHYFSLFISTEILLKGPLKAKQQQHKFNFSYSLTELKLPVKDGKEGWP